VSITSDIVRTKENMTETGSRMSIVFKIGIPSEPDRPAVIGTEEYANLCPGNLGGAATLSQIQNGFGERDKVLRSKSRAVVRFYLRELELCRCVRSYR
jgi:hypothetical protein